MSKAMHTPGPWAIRESATHVTVSGADGETLFHDDKKCPRVVEDARLIAAAPELLEALQTCIGVMKLQRDVIERGAHASAWALPIATAEAAIRKATGETQ